MHVSCVNFSLHLQFDPAFDAKEQLISTDFSFMLKKHTCYICESNYGYSIKCAKNACLNHFHVSCGQKNGLIPNSYSNLDGYFKNGQYTMCCETHLKQINVKTAKLAMKIKENFLKNRERFSFILNQNKPRESFKQQKQIRQSISKDHSAMNHSAKTSSTDQNKE